MFFLNLLQQVHAVKTPAYSNGSLLQSPAVAGLASVWQRTASIHNRMKRPHIKSYGAQFGPYFLSGMVFQRRITKAIFGMVSPTPNLQSAAQWCPPDLLLLKLAPARQPSVQVCEVASLAAEAPLEEAHCSVQTHECAACCVVGQFIYIYKYINIHIIFLRTFLYVQKKLAFYRVCV